MAAISHPVSGLQRYLFLYDIVSKQFTTTKPYAITKAVQFDWQKNITVVKDCPVLLMVRVTATSVKDAKEKALQLVETYLNHKK